MGDEEKDDQQTEDKSSDEETSESDDKTSGSEIEERRNDPDYKRTTDPNADENSDSKCPECDAPVDDVRVTCPNCGYEYKKEDYSDKEAGNEFKAGTALDDEGNEQPDDPSGN